MNPPLLSIVFAWMNAEGDVKGAFTSVANQINIDKSRIELLLIDDGSTDKTLEEVEQYKALLNGYRDFRTIKHGARQGVAKTKYDGAKRAHGKYITFVDKRVRPDKDYIYNLLNKNRGVVVGNAYMRKNRSGWGRVLALVRKKLYFPYFNHPFDDIALDAEAYKKFKNKGGGGVMLVLRDYYLQAAQSKNLGINVNDDSMLIERFAEIEPLLKTSSANAEYLNRESFSENVIHIFNRGPKFVDYYINPGSRFFPFIMLLIVVFMGSIIALVVAPIFVLYELLAFLLSDIVIAVWLGEEWIDIWVCALLLPVALIAFSSGILKGLAMKILRIY